MSEPSASPRPQSAQFVIDSIEGLKALGEPLRFRILMAAAEADFTVKELAARLGVPQTRLYYHVGILEKVGLLRVAARRIVSGIEERRYEATAENWTIAPELFADIKSSGLLKAAFDIVRTELEHVFDTGGPGEDVGTAASAIPVLSITQFEMTPEEVADFLARMTALLSEYAVPGWGAPPTPGKQIYNAMFVTYKHPGSLDAP